MTLPVLASSRMAEPAVIAGAPSVTGKASGMSRFELVDVEDDELSEVDFFFFVAAGAVGTRAKSRKVRTTSEAKRFMACATKRIRAISASRDTGFSGGRR